MMGSDFAALLMRNLTTLRVFALGERLHPGSLGSTLAVALTPPTFGLHRRRAHVVAALDAPEGGEKETSCTSCRSVRRGEHN